jgi:hypothetical protein
MQASFAARALPADAPNEPPSDLDFLPKTPYPGISKKDLKPLLFVSRRRVENAAGAPELVPYVAGLSARKVPAGFQSCHLPITSLPRPSRRTGAARPVPLIAEDQVLKSAKPDKRRGNPAEPVLEMMRGASVATLCLVFVGGAGSTHVVAESAMAAPQPWPGCVQFVPPNALSLALLRTASGIEAFQPLSPGAPAQASGP